MANRSLADHSVLDRYGVFVSCHGIELVSRRDSIRRSQDCNTIQRTRGRETGGEVKRHWRADKSVRVVGCLSTQLELVYKPREGSAVLGLKPDSREALCILFGVLRCEFPTRWGWYQTVTPTVGANATAHTSSQNTHPSKVRLAPVISRKRRTRLPRPA